MYYLTDKKIIERVIEYVPTLQEIEKTIEGIKDKGLKKLISLAISFYKQPKPDSHIIAVEQLWDAFERLKTYYGSKKDSSAELLLTNMSNQEQQFKFLLSAEFSELTKIGNEYRIRHHEINKIDIFDARHWDYLFNRCLSLIGLAIYYLEE